MPDKFIDVKFRLGSERKFSDSLRNPTSSEYRNLEKELKANVSDNCIRYTQASPEICKLHIVVILFLLYKSNYFPLKECLYITSIMHGVNGMCKETPENVRI